MQAAGCPFPLRLATTTPHNTSQSREQPPWQALERSCANLQRRDACAAACDGSGQGISKDMYLMGPMFSIMIVVLNSLVEEVSVNKPITMALNSMTGYLNNMNQCTCPLLYDQVDVLQQKHCSLNIRSLIVKWMQQW
jgi:hypothetical protein